MSRRTGNNYSGARRAFSSRPARRCSSCSGPAAWSVTWHGKPAPELLCDVCYDAKSAATARTWPGHPGHAERLA